MKKKNDIQHEKLKHITGYPSTLGELKQAAHKLIVSRV